jgi:uncharacterized protein (DUF2267 family)
MINSITVFNKTLEKSDQWLSDLMTIAALEDKEQAYIILRTVLHSLRDRVLADEAVNFASQLPMLLRGMYYEGWKISRTPTLERSQKEFMAHIAGELEKHAPILEMTAEEAMSAVINLLKKKISQGEIEDMQAMLPASLKEFIAFSS